MYPSFYNGEILQPLEFRDGIRLRLCSLPDNLYKKCDGYQCDKDFSIQHALTCKKGGLIIQRHNDLRDELIYLFKLFTPNSYVKKEPYIHGSRIDLSNVDDINLHEQGDIQVRNIWENQKDCIIDVRITHLDSKSYKNKDGSVVLKSQEEEKRKSI